MIPLNLRELSKAQLIEIIDRKNRNLEVAIEENDKLQQRLDAAHAVINTSKMKFPLSDEESPSAKYFDSSKPALEAEVAGLKEVIVHLVKKLYKENK